MPPETLASLLRVAEALASSLELEDVLQTAIESACALFGLHTGAVYVLDEQAMYLGATTPPLEPAFPEEFRHQRLSDHPHVAESLSTTEPIYLADARVASLSPEERAISDARGLCSILYIPLLLTERPIGVMILGSTDDVRTFESGDIDLARMFAAQAALAVANARLFESVQRANAEINRINTHLEQIVQERTEALTVANEELQCQAVNLEEQAQELADANDAKARFLRSMSHELRTPLNSIIGFSGIMLQGLAGDLTDEQRVQLEMINGSGQHLLAIMRDLLDLSRIDAGVLQISHDVIDVPSLVQECILSVTPQAEAKALKLTAYTHDPAPPLVSDTVRVRQILLNLLGNAVKFTENGGVSVIIDRPSAPVITIAVHDTGSGIPGEDLDSVFGEFEQVLRVRDRQLEGTGLGLAISRKLAAVLGGTLSVKSALGEGSTFTLTLPCGPEAVVDSPLPARGISDRARLIGGTSPDVDADR